MPAPSASSLWRRNVFGVRTLALDTYAVYVAGHAPAILPAFGVEFALDCEEFRPMREHLAEYAGTHHLDALQMHTLEGMLPALAEAGLLVSTAELWERFAAMPDEGGVAITLLGMPTGGKRQALVERGLRSLADNFARHGRTADFLVADSSSRAEDAAATRALLESMKLPAFFAGEAEKRAFIAELDKAGACAPEVAEFALLDPERTGFACGANRNTLLLHGAGKALSSMDDDVICRFAGPPTRSESGVGYYSHKDLLARRTFPGRAEAPWEEADYLGLHESLLGRSPAQAQRGLTTGDFSQAEDDLVKRALRGDCRVRATFTGHIGDPGIPTSAYYLYYEGANRDRLCENEADYRAALSSRSVHCAAPCPTLGDASLSPGMSYALDGRSLLPPFFPVLHAEDFSYSAALWQSCPEALLAHLPWAIQHEPARQGIILTPAEIGPGKRAAIFEFAHLLRRMLFALKLPAQAPMESRLRLLGTTLAHYGRLPPRGWRDLLVEHAVKEASGRIQYLQQQLDEAPDAPDFWRDDVEHLLEQLAGAVGDPDMEIPLDLQGERTPDESRALMQRLVGRYGELLIAWPAMVEASGALRERGITLGHRV